MRDHNAFCVGCRQERRSGGARRRAARQGAQALLCFGIAEQRRQCPRNAPQGRFGILGDRRITTDTLERREHVLSERCQHQRRGVARGSQTAIGTSAAGRLLIDAVAAS